MKDHPESRRRRLILLLSAISFPAWAARRILGSFSSGDLGEWQEKSFDGETQYQVKRIGDRSALYADSRASASGLYREVQVDLESTPYLHWSWRVESLLEGNDERSKSGDDYPARVYVIFSGGLLFWRTRAINYVWSSNQRIGSAWPNAFTANARMIAVRAGSEYVGKWVRERRDVRADYRRLFKEKPGKVAAVALMTDTDNTGQSAQAWYGDIWFDDH